MEKKYKVCQSCGAPIKKASKRGTEADGSKSNKYCAYCYQNGQFTHDIKDAKEMQGLLIDFFTKKKFPR